jgi:hypothetical protein
MLSTSKVEEAVEEPPDQVDKLFPFQSCGVAPRVWLSKSSEYIVVCAVACKTNASAPIISNVVFFIVFLFLVVNNALCATASWARL